jgi:hypothetical protein
MCHETIFQFLCSHVHSTGIDRCFKALEEDLAQCDNLRTDSLEGGEQCWQCQARSQGAVDDADEDEHIRLALEASTRGMTGLWLDDEDSITAATKASRIQAYGYDPLNYVPEEHLITQGEIDNWTQRETIHDHRRAHEDYNAPNRDDHDDDDETQVDAILYDGGDGERRATHVERVSPQYDARFGFQQESEIREKPILDHQLPSTEEMRAKRLAQVSKGKGRAPVAGQPSPKVAPRQQTSPKLSKSPTKPHMSTRPTMKKSQAPRGGYEASNRSGPSLSRRLSPLDIQQQKHVSSRPHEVASPQPNTPNPMTTPAPVKDNAHHRPVLPLQQPQSSDSDSEDSRVKTEDNSRAGPTTARPSLPNWGIKEEPEPAVAPFVPRKADEKADDETDEDEEGEADVEDFVEEVLSPAKLRAKRLAALSPNKGGASR